MMIKIFKGKIADAELRDIAQKTFGHMVKGVVDIRQKMIALGGELHADAEEILLSQGSRQEDLWGFNIYPDKSLDERMEYTSLINIRPRQDNYGREIQSVPLRQEIKKIIDEALG